MAKLSMKTTTMLSLSTLGANSTTGLEDCTAVDCKEAVSLALTVRCAYDASASEGCTVRIYGSPDGANYDTVELTLFENEFSPGKTRQKTVFVDPAARFLKATVRNDDDSCSISDLSVTAQLRRMRRR